MNFSLARFISTGNSSGDTDNLIPPIGGIWLKPIVLSSVFRGG